MAQALYGGAVGHAAHSGELSKAIPQDATARLKPCPFKTNDRMIAIGCLRWLQPGEGGIG